MSSQGRKDGRIVTGAARPAAARRAAPTGDRGMRASDEERGRTAAALGDHYAAGRLTLEEFHERLDKAYTAKTRGELDELVADLPRTDLGRLPGGPVQVPAYGAALARRAPWRFWVGVSVGFLVIWLLSGPGGPWLLWVALLLALLVLWRRIGSGPPRDHRNGRAAP